MPLRYVLLLGPWRSLLIRLLRTLRKNPPVVTNSEPLFNRVDATSAATRLAIDGFTGGLQLAPEYVHQIVADPRSRKRLLNPHESMPAVARIAHNSQVVDIARQYLGVEPIIHSSVLYWTHPATDESPYRSQLEMQPFHFDVADFKSLTLFIYLTDVDSDCGPHSVIVGTHERKMLDVLKRKMPDDEAQRRYNGRIKVITGQRGTAFCEDLVAYHRRTDPVLKPRLVLWVNYVIARRRPWTRKF